MTEAAVEELPTPLKTYFENYKTQVKNIAATEPPSTHFIDIDYYPEFFAHTFPRDINVLIAEYGTTIVYQNGTGPWTAVNYYETLRDQFAVATTESDWTNLLATAGALAHYLEDLHNPMHLAINYDGQLTGQNGLHSRYESTLIQNRITAGLQLATNLTDCVFHPSIQDAIFDDIDLVYPYNQTLLNADLSAYAATGERISANYYQHLWDDGCSSFTSFVMQKGSALAASAWYAAWREAGFPQPPGVTASQLVTLRLLSLDNNGGRLAFVGDAGQRLELQTTTNLINWTWQATITNLDGRMEITIPPPTNYVQQYYRAVIIDVAGAVASAIAEALNATNLAWTTAGNAPWFVQSAVTHDGVAAVRSGVIVNSRQSTLQTAVTGPGTLSFWWKVSSENSYDYLRFYTNTVELAAISGEFGWEQKTFYLGDGAQALQWIYSKDVSLSYGQDAGWLDEVTFLPGATPATIASPLADQSVAAGVDVTLSVSAVGTPRLSYQWQLNGTNLPGANSTSLVLRNVQAVNTGDYGVVVSNGHGTNSTTARLTVNPSAPMILVPPSGQLAATRGSGAFTVSARGSEPLAYQWQFNGADIAETTNSTLVLENIQATSAGGYRVTVSNANGVMVSPSAALVVGPAVVVAWGDNSDGQTNVPLSLTNMTAVAGGSYHSLALRSSGTLVAWGYNGYGQANVPARATNVTAIAAGAYHSLALRADGSVVAWGYNGYGQTDVPPAATNVTSVAAGTYHSLAARAGGMVLAWGYNGYGQTNVPPRATNTVALAAGSYHSLALRGDGTVVAWGYNGYGQTNVPPRATNVVAIAAGSYHSLALRADGTVVAWGYNGYGLTNAPAHATNVVAIAAGSYHNLALRADGTVVVWGYNSYGQTNVPSRVTKPMAIAGGANHSLSIVNDGSPFIVRQPGKQTVTRGNTAVFRVDALGDSPLNYQWRLDGINLAGATNSSLNLPSSD